jgi:hypothetical protein
MRTSRKDVTSDWEIFNDGFSIQPQRFDCGLPHCVLLRFPVHHGRGSDECGKLLSRFSSI